MVTTSDAITERIYVKYVYSDKEIVDLSRKKGQLDLEINEKSEALATMTKTIKAEIGELTAQFRSCGEKLRSGYEMRPRDCVVRYEDGLAKFYDKTSGEFLQERSMSTDEQLRLTGNRVDAEQIIRQDRDRLDSED
jgi:hypothetical protein